MTKPVTGQYECLHKSGIGLDYFTSRIDRLVLQAGGRFTFSTQDRSRIVNAAQSFISSQQVVTNAPETRREGTYTVQGNILQLHFDDGTQEQGQLSWNGEGIQFDKDFFNKISDSTLLPSTHRLKKDMDDIAKGLKIASTIGGMAIKAAKTIHDTMQTTQEPDATRPQPQVAPPVQQPVSSVPPVQRPVPQPPVPPAAQQATSQPHEQETLFCDQCGTRCGPGKKFCNHCGARLP